MNFFCFCAFAWSEGTGGRDGGREEGGFFLGKHEFPHIFDGFGAIPHYIGFPQENVRYLKENVRYLGFPRETTVFLTFWTDFVPFPTFPDENLRLVVVALEKSRHYLGCGGGCCCCYCSSCGCC